MAAVLDLLLDLQLHLISACTFLSTFVIITILYLFYSSSGPRKNEPPGPRPLPLLGNLQLLDPKSPQTSLYQLSKKYGPVYTMHFGPKKTVVLTGYKTIKQALVNSDAFTFREQLPIINDLKLAHGIIFSNGDTWKEMRRFALSNLKQFGMGKTSNEEKIVEEIQHLIEAFKKKEGKPFDTTDSVGFAVCNIVCSFVFGRRFEDNDRRFRSMIDQIRKNTKLMGSPSIQLYNSFPRLFHWLSARKQLIMGAFANRQLVSEMIKHLQDSLNPKLCRGFVDSFLVRKNKHEVSGKTHSHYHEDNLQLSVVNMFTAGTDSSTSTLRFGLLLMAKYPDVQDRVQTELTRVVGNRQTRAEDRKNLPYTDAVIHEIQRMTNAVPINIRCASRDVTLQDFFIKKGTPVVVLLSSILQDEDMWEKAYSFNPEHFLDEEGNFRKRDAFLPFSLGSRSCVGEGLAKVELFLFFTSLLQHFCFTPPPGVMKEELDLTPVMGFALSPPPHVLCAVSRH